LSNTILRDTRHRNLFVPIRRRRRVTYYSPVISIIYLKHDPNINTFNLGNTTDMNSFILLLNCISNIKVFIINKFKRIINKIIL